MGQEELVTPKAVSGLLKDLWQQESDALRAHDYLAYHHRRFQYVFEKCKDLRSDPANRVLDIGRSHLSSLLLSHYHYVTTLGLPLSGTERYGHEVGTATSGPASFAGHIEFDLNDAQTQASIEWPERFDLIVFAEVAEHLYTAPELVLHALSTLLSVDGLIVCQTPNAAALHKRLKLLIGVHPYERIRMDRGNPGHFREYTRRELVEIGTRVGLEIHSHEYVDYFGLQGGVTQQAATLLVKAVSLLFPSSARGQTIVYQRRK